jgi:type IV pilus assembly protein PilW
MKFTRDHQLKAGPSRIKNQRGYTITELLMSLGISLMVLAAVYGVFRSQTHTVKGQESKMEASEYALNIIDMMVREIRNTGYFPTGVACSSPANTAGIVSASATSLRIVYDSNGDGACEEDVAFTYDSTTQNVLRNTATLTDANATALLFTYYPQQTSGSAPSPFCFPDNTPTGCSGTLDLAAVQKITISVTVQSKNPNIDFGGQSTTTMSSSADLRNHGLAS